MGVRFALMDLSADYATGHDAGAKSAGTIVMFRGSLKGTRLFLCDYGVRLSVCVIIVYDCACDYGVRLCVFLSVTHTHAYIHTERHTHAISLFLSLSLCFSRFVSLSITLFLSLSSLSLLSLCFSLSFSLSLITLFLSPSSLSFSLSYLFSVSLYLCLQLINYHHLQCLLCFPATVRLSCLRDGSLPLALPPVRFAKIILRFFFCRPLLSLFSTSCDT